MQLDMSRIGRGTGPVSNRNVFSVLKSITMTEIIKKGDGNPNLRNDFISRYRRWIEACSVAPVTGLEHFPKTYFVNGVTQSYDIFFSENRGRRFRTLKGEYPYVRLSVDEWCHVEEDEIRASDALALTYPFYGDGGSPRHFEGLLDRCLELGVPVLIDAAYFGTCYGVSFDYSHPAIEMLSFSLSKPFSIQSCRAGILFMKRSLGYLEEIQVQSNYFNKFGAYIGLRLMQEFPADFIPLTYRSAHQKICRDLDLIPTHCLMLANVKDEDRRFDGILKDERFEELALPEGAYRRICVSSYLSDADPVWKKAAKRMLRRA